MTIAISLFGVIMIGLCIWGISTPVSMMNSVRGIWNRPWGIHFAVAIRIGLGVLFVLAADETRYPGVVRFLGYLMIVAAAMIVMIGRERLDRFIQWWVDASPAFARAWLVLGMAFGAFLLYAAN
jgi:hypothetical protein